MKRFIAFASFLFLASAASAVTTQHFAKSVNNQTWVTVTVNPTGALDVLFVVDDSGSMSEHQQNLATNVKAFTDVFKPGSDINAAVITTSATNTGFPGSTCCGHFKGPVINSVQDGAFLEHLSANLNVGTEGEAYEMPFQTLKQALSEPLLSTTNKDFLRPFADLMVVILTDTQDQSTITAADLGMQLKNLKPNQTIFTLAGLVLDPKVCIGEVEMDQPDKKIQDFVGIFSGTIFDLCGDFSQNLVEALSKVGSIEKEIELPVPANTKAVLSTIQVKMNGKDLPFGDIFNGWVYNSAKNIVILGEGVFANGSGQVTITYQVK